MTLMMKQDVVKEQDKRGTRTETSSRFKPAAKQTRSQ
jgi:hypothetical protein